MARELGIRDRLVIEASEAERKRAEHHRAGRRGVAQRYAGRAELAGIIVNWIDNGVPLWPERDAK